MSPELARIILAQICLHACMAGTRMAAPLLALREGYSPAAVGVLLALFALTQVFLALPSGRFADRHGLKRPLGLSVIAAVIGAGAAVANAVHDALAPWGVHIASQPYTPEKILQALGRVGPRA